MSAELRSLDDYVDTPKGLESLAKVLIKSRLATMPKIYVFSTAWNKNDFLSGFTKMQPILTKHEDCTIIYLGTYYKPMKMRKRRNRTWNTQN